MIFNRRQSSFREWHKALCPLDVLGRYAFRFPNAGTVDPVQCLFFLDLEHDQGFQDA